MTILKPKEKGPVIFFALFFAAGWTAIYVNWFNKVT